MASSDSSPFGSFWAQYERTRQSPQAHNGRYPEPRGGNIPSPSFLPRSPRLSSPGRSGSVVFNNCTNCASEHKKLEDEQKKVNDLESRINRLFRENRSLKDVCSRQEHELDELEGYFSALSVGEGDFMQHARSVADQACQRAEIDRKKVDELREYVDYQIECYSKAFTEISKKEEQLKASCAAEIEEQREENRAVALRLRAVEASKDEQIRSLEAELARAKQDCARMTALMIRLRELQPPTTNGPAHSTPSSNNDVAEAEAEVRHLVDDRDGDAQQRAAVVTTLEHRITGPDTELRAAFAELDELNEFESGPSSA